MSLVVHNLSLERQRSYRLNLSLTIHSATRLALIQHFLPRLLLLRPHLPRHSFAPLIARSPSGLNHRNQHRQGIALIGLLCSLPAFPASKLPESVLVV